MLKLKVARPQGDLFVIGLSRRNIELLLAKHPALVQLALLGGPAVDVMIYAGETEEAMLEEFVQEGLVPAALAKGKPH